MSFARCTGFAAGGLYGRLGAVFADCRRRAPSRSAASSRGSTSNRLCGSPRRPRRARARAAPRRRGPAGRGRTAARRRSAKPVAARTSSAAAWRTSAHVERVGELVGVDAVARRRRRTRPGRRRPRTRSTWRSRPPGSRRPPPRPCTVRVDVRGAGRSSVEPELAGADSAQPVSQCRGRGSEPCAARRRPRRPARRASRPGRAAKSSRSQSRSKSPTSPKLIAPVVGQQRDAEALVLGQRHHRERVEHAPAQQVERELRARARSSRPG